MFSVVCLSLEIGVNDLEWISNLLVVARDDCKLLCVWGFVSWVLVIVGCSSDPGVVDMV